MQAVNTVKNTPHSIAKPLPKLSKNWFHCVCPIMHEPIRAPKMAAGIPIKQK
jgi:hypothetical protein